MIPRRISLRGFLCYRDEQEVDFTGATLWMLGGPNGSGKSAIFDAVTYALFGHHRGGSQHAAELINKDADGLQVEFDFALDGEVYRAKRTLRKSNRGPAATQGIYRYQATADGRGKWQPIPDTNRKTEYDAWVRERIGLNYETFTSSVLLLQGRAEKLLDSAAKGRFEVLAGIVDLERYVRLHANADDRRRESKAKYEALRHQLDAIPAATDEELAAVDQQITAAETNLAAVRSEIEAMQTAEVQARQWAELQNKAAGVAKRWQDAQGLLAAADVIERDAARCRELIAIVPHLETAIKQRSQIAESLRTSEGLNAKRQSAEQRLVACDQGLNQAQQKRSALQKTIAADDQRQRDLQARLRRLEGVRVQVTMFEQQKRELGRQEAELARLPADIEARHAAAQVEHDEISTLASVAPSLARFAQARDDLRQARDRERLSVQQEQKVKDRGEELTTELASLAPQVEARAASRRSADDAATAAKALLKQARDEEAAFQELDGARTCRRCGQELTPDHYALEMEKRRAEVNAADAKVRELASAQVDAQKVEAEIRRRVAELEAERQVKRDGYREVRGQLEMAREEAERHARDCGVVYHELPESFRGKVAAAAPADWLTTVYPTSADVSTARSRIAGLETVRTRMKDLQQQKVSWTALQGQVQTLKQGVAALQSSLPGEPDEIHRDFQRTEADEQAAVGGLKAARAEARAVQEELDRLTTDRQEIEAALATIQRQIHAEEVMRKLCRQSVEASLRLLPATWKESAQRAALSELHVWQTERDELVDRNVEQQALNLQQSRTELETLRTTKTELDQQIESVPIDARRPVTEVQAALRTARQRNDAAEEAVRRGRSTKALLDDRRQRRSELHDAALAADGAQARSLKLAQLLGRENLQLHLVRTAERQIVDHANAVLDRLSGGQLYMRLRAGEEGGESDKALELDAYNRTTGGSAINVAFLSGSQRFRVAVSLALGIGRYASRRHRPIESVIIDEGFGCLDRNGRQVMIQELQNLRGHLQCILLVSHQEEFADAFTDGYRFELTNGSTRVTRVGR